MQQSLNKSKLNLKFVVSGFVVIILYYVCAKIGLTMATVTKSASPVWPASAIGAAAALILGYRVAPFICIAAFLSNLNLGFSFTWHLVIASGNTLEALVAAYILKRSNLLGLKIMNYQTQIIFYLICVAIATPISALTGTLSLIFNGNIPYAEFFKVFTTWWSGDSLGILMLCPIIIYAYENYEKINIKKLPTALLLSIPSVLISYIIFQYEQKYVATAFLILPFLFLLSYKYQLASKISTLLFSVSSIYFVINDSVLFTGSGLNAALLSLQVIIAVTVFSELFFNEITKISNITQPALMLFVSWCLGALAVFFVQEYEIKDSKRYFETIVDENMERLNIRMKTYESALRGASGLFLASKSVEGDEWKAYVETLNLKENFPGILGLGFIKYLEPKDYDRFIKTTSEDMKSEFKIKNLGDIPVNKEIITYPIVYLEPKVGNLSAIGLNIASEMNRKTAADEAKKTNSLALTNPITLVQDTRKRPGFLLLLPLRIKSEFFGWIYTPIVIDDFLSGISSSNSGLVSFDFFKLSPNNDKTLLFTNIEDHHLDAQFSYTTTIPAWNQKFEMNWHTTEKYPTHKNFLTLCAFLVWNLLFALLASIMSNLKFLTLRAQEMVVEKTKEIYHQGKLWKTLTESSPVGILQTDVFGCHQYSNSRLHEITQFSLEELDGKIWTQLCHPESLDNLIAAWKKYLGGDQFSIEAKCAKPNGSLAAKWLLIKASAVLSPEGIPQSHIISFQDITESKEQHLALAQSSKMASLGEMASGIAHEINNPLAVIKGFAEQLLRKEESGQLNSETTKKNLNKIISTTDRITTIIKGLRNFSRSGITDDYIKCNLKDITDDVLSFCSERIKNYSTDIQINLPINIIFEAQVTQISQVLLNLLNNSLDAIQEFPNKWIKIDYSPINEAKFALKVTDSGGGIDPSIIDKLMQPFFTTKGPGKGTGLGLSISKGIIEAHGGNFYVDQKSANTCFVIELPYEQTRKALNVAA